MSYKEKRKNSDLTPDWKQYLFVLTTLMALIILVIIIVLIMIGPTIANVFSDIPTCTLGSSGM